MKLNKNVLFVFLILLFMAINLNASIRLQVNDIQTKNIYKIIPTNKYLLFFDDDGKFSILDKQTFKVLKKYSTILYGSVSEEIIYKYKNKISFINQNKEIVLLNIDDFTEEKIGRYRGGPIAFSDKYIFINGSVYNRKDMSLIKMLRPVRSIYSSESVAIKRVILDDNRDKLLLVYDYGLEIFDLNFNIVIKKIFTARKVHPLLLEYNKEEGNLYYAPSYNRSLMNILNIDTFKHSKIELKKNEFLVCSDNKMYIIEKGINKKKTLSRFVPNTIFENSHSILIPDNIYSFTYNNGDYYITTKDALVKKITKTETIDINPSTSNIIFHFEEHNNNTIYYLINNHQLSVQVINKQGTQSYITISIKGVEALDFETVNIMSDFIKVYTFDSNRYITVGNRLYKYNYKKNTFKFLDEFDSSIKGLYIENEQNIYIFFNSGIVHFKNKMDKKNIFQSDEINNFTKLENFIIFSDKERNIYRFDCIDMSTSKMQIFGIEYFQKYLLGENKIIAFLSTYGYGFEKGNKIIILDVNTMAYTHMPTKILKDKGGTIDNLSFNPYKLEFIENTYGGSLNRYHALTLDKKGNVKNVYNKVVHYRKIDDKYLHIIENNKIKIYNLDDYELVLTKYVYHDAFIELTPSGYFSGFGKLEKYIHYIKDETEIIKFNQLYDHFFRPDLVKLKLAGEDISKYTNGLTYQEALSNPPPKLSFKSIDKKEVKISGFEYDDVKTSKEKIKLSFNVNEHDNGGIGLIRIYQEGKLIQTIGEGKINKQSANVDTILEQEEQDEITKAKQDEYVLLASKSLTSNINMSVEDTIEQVKLGTTTNTSGTYELEIELKSGKNEISIEAFNKTNTVTSYRENITINANIPKHKPKLYAIVVGVNEFEVGSVNNLQYSQNDAKAIKEAAQKKMGTVFEDVEVKYLIGKDVTKSNILKAAQDISKKAKLDDTVLFYISTHGRAYKGKLYLVPYNNKSVSNWIDFEQTFKAVQSIKALNQIFVIDACESGKANDIVSSVYDSRASVLAKSSGVHVLLATTKGTSAFEHPDKNIKNGVFTYRILEAMKDKSTDKNKDSFISILELSKHLKESANNNDYQHPVIRNVGSDVKLERIER